MKTTQSTTNWIVDAVLFSGLILASLLDLTGLALHQWLGVAVAALAIYHFSTHWTWVKNVYARFSGRTSNQARLYFLVDVALFTSLAMVVMTGLVISTWLDLPFINFSNWRHLHIVITIIVLVITLIKVAIHSRWIIHTTRRLFGEKRQPTILPGIQGQSAGQPIPADPSPVALRNAINRRDFFKLMGITGLATLVALYGAMDEISETQASQNSASIEEINENSENSIQSTTQQSVSNQSCTVRCNRGCSFPGHCHRYQDRDQNNRCDWGECT